MMNISKEEYLQNVLESYRMSHVEELKEKYLAKRDDVKEKLEKEFGNSMYNPINSGSFAKHTAINSKFDLDLAAPFKKDSFDKLENLFNKVYDFIYEKYSNVASIRRQKVSIGIEFFADENGDVVKLDVVPGRELNHNQYSEDKKMNLFVNSPYGLLSEKSYIQTNIQAQIDHIKAKENERKVIRLLKIWKNYNNEKYKSFLLELLVIKAFDKEEITGNLWEKLKNVMNYIKDNVNKESFTLKDPGNSGNDVIATLDKNDRENFAYTLGKILDNIEHNENNLEMYFPINNEFKNKVKKEGYGVKNSDKVSTPPNTRFG